MYQVQNTKTGKFLKDAITCKPHQFADIEHAQKWADDAHRNSVLNATAWNSTRPTKYAVIVA